MAINWAKNIEKLNSQEGNKPEGKNWFTANEFIENNTYGVTKSYKQLKKLVSDGTLEVFRGSQWNEEMNQCTRKVWYRFV